MDPLLVRIRRLHLLSHHQPPRHLHQQGIVHHEKRLLRNHRFMPVADRLRWRRKIKVCKRFRKIRSIDVSINTPPIRERLLHDVHRMPSHLGHVQLAADVEQRIPKRFKIKPPHVVPPQCPIRRILLRIRKIRLAALHVHRRHHDRLVDRLQAPTAAHELVGKIIQ